MFYNRFYLPELLVCNGYKPGFDLSRHILLGVDVNLCLWVYKMGKKRFCDQNGCGKECEMTCGYDPHWICPACDSTYSKKKMIIDCISDLHGAYPELPGGDLLIIAGDLTTNDSVRAWKNYFDWIKDQKYRKIIYIAGNHDGFLSQSISSKEAERLGLADSQEPAEYVCDNLTEFDGLKIYGSPWTPRFYDWHFMKNTKEELKDCWDLIPEDLDILITHGPPYGIRDKSRNQTRCGCDQLLDAVKRTKPRIHIFGHIHGGYGLDEKDGTLFINAAHMDEDYEPNNKPIRIIYAPEERKVESCHLPKY